MAGLKGIVLQNKAKCFFRTKEMHKLSLNKNKMFIIVK